MEADKKEEETVIRYAHELYSIRTFDLLQRELQMQMKFSIIFSESEPDDNYDPHEHRQTKSPTK